MVPKQTLIAAAALLAAVTLAAAVAAPAPPRPYVERFNNVEEVPDAQAVAVVDAHLAASKVRAFHTMNPDQALRTVVQDLIDVVHGEFTDGIYPPPYSRFMGVLGLLAFQREINTYTAEQMFFAHVPYKLQKEVDREEFARAFEANKSQYAALIAPVLAVYGGEDDMTLATNLVNKHQICSDSRCDPDCERIAKEAAGSKPATRWALYSSARCPNIDVSA